MPEATEDSGTTGENGGTAVTGSDGDGRRSILCPRCLYEFDWDADPTLYERTAGDLYTAIPAGGDQPELLRKDRELDAWKKCPTQPRDGEKPHYLPVGYGGHGRPMVVGFVGTIETGKSHLLATMVKEIGRGALEALGAKTDPLDYDIHDEYVAEYVNPLFETGRSIPPNQRLRDAAEATFRDAFLVTYGSVTRPVAFFDVSGEDLALKRARSNDFMLAVDALIFVVDWNPGRLRRVESRPVSDEPVGGDGPERVGPTIVDDPAITRVVRRLQHQDRGRAVPAAMAITKCDELRFTDPVMRWLRRPGLSAFRPVSDPDLNLLWRESRDAYAFLYEREMHSWLRPYSVFAQTTLHFVSATGSAGVDEENEFGEPIKRFVRGVLPQRVLDPLVAVLAMSGMFGPAAQRVGIWPYPPEAGRQGSPL
jgi:hypothetical protein